MAQDDHFHKYKELTEYLHGEGYNDEQVQQIILDVQEYEVDVRVDSIMDSIGSGQLDIQKVIEEALKKLED